MKILIHHIYEYKKGLRHLVLHTLKIQYREEAERKLKSMGICYFISEVSKDKINIFFGNCNCVSIIQSFNKNKLTDYTPEEDFILGTMLGYAGLEQCNRYLMFKNKKLTEKL